MSSKGYTPCPCRDCMEISMDDDLCHDCKEAGCEPNAGECESDTAYGGGIEDKTDA